MFIFLIIGINGDYLFEIVFYDKIYILIMLVILYKMEVVVNVMMIVSGI